MDISFEFGKHSLGYWKYFHELLAILLRIVSVFVLQSKLVHRLGKNLADFLTFRLSEKNS